MLSFRHVTSINFFYKFNTSNVIIGWSFGGGHSPLGPIHGLGVDQMLEVELVGADGSYIIANVNGTSVRSAGKIINNFSFN